MCVDPGGTTPPPEPVDDAPGLSPPASGATRAPDRAPGARTQVPPAGPESSPVVEVPALSLVLLIGASGSGKSTFAARHFGRFEVVSSDFCRGLVANDEDNQAATPQAFALLHALLRQRLQLGHLTVVDATNLRPEDRKPLVAIAREFHALPTALVFDIPERVCHERNRSPDGRNLSPHVIRNQRVALRKNLRGLWREGFRKVVVFSHPAEVDGATIRRVPLWTDRRTETGPFDIIGDVHGCLDELHELLTRLAYRVEVDAAGQPQVEPPPGRRAIFLGDLVDRGPAVPGVLRLVMSMVRAGSALCVPGNHDMKLLRHLQGKQVHPTHGLDLSIAQLDEEPATFRAEVQEFLDSLISHYVLDGGRLVVAHAGLRAEMHGRASGAVREFCLFGETTGETDEFGLPVRHNWAEDYRASAMVVYGHTPVPEANWLNHTINIDTGCVFGGHLTALRYPERELVSVPAQRIYCEPLRPLAPSAQAAAAGLTPQQAADDTLDLADVLGKRQISTRLRGMVSIREEHAAAALEAMSRFAANPRWLIYMPPTMSPCETSSQEGFLEHPAEALAYYRDHGCGALMCERKHMGSRAVVIACRDEEAARTRFGVTDEGAGCVLTRTGRRFFADRAREAELVDRVRAALEATGIFAELDTSWVLLDCELMPWSAKAQELLRGQYAAVGAAGSAALAAAEAALEAASSRTPEAAPLLARTQARHAALQSYVEAYRQYCWPVSSVSDLRLAPFHLLASEGRVHLDRPHDWHLALAARLAGTGDPVFEVTEHRTVDATNPKELQEAVDWWQEITTDGSEGMVVKPRAFLARGPRGLLQPAVKCRGREYLRIIYGPEYTAPEHLARLRKRGLAGKRALALGEFALGVEALERFVRREPLRRVHECVFGVLALESEPVDPRL